LGYLGVMAKFLEIYDLFKLNDQETENLNRPNVGKETKSVIKNISKKRSPGPDGFSGEFCQTFKEELAPVLLKLFQKMEEEGTLPNSF